MTARSEEGKRARRFRLLVRCCVLAASVVLVLGVLPWAWAPMVLPSLSPHVMICSAVAARAIGAATLVGLPVLALVLLRRRWFCRHACPVGLITEQVSRLRASAKPKVGRLPSLGRWIVLLTLGGALLGYPLLMWLDPLAIFHGVFSLRSDPLSLAGQASAVALAVILNLSLLLPGSWCMKVCPLGATQDLLALPRRLLRPKEARVAPAGDPRPLSRRWILSVAFGAACLGLGAAWARAAKGRSRSDRARLLRPPGSADEASFAGLCLRCGNCLRACPTRIIRPDLGRDGIAGFLAPTLSFEEGYCREDCHRCTQVCPSGAIAQLSLEEKWNAPIGVAKVDMSLCLANDRECRICEPACPYGAVNIGWSDKEYMAVVQVDADKCPGCGACQLVCPGTSEPEHKGSPQPTRCRKAIEVHASR